MEELSTLHPMQPMLMQKGIIPSPRLSRHLNARSHNHIHIPFLFTCPDPTHTAFQLPFPDSDHLQTSIDKHPF